MIKIDDIWQVNEHVRFRRMFDEGVVIHQDQDEALVLNDSGVAFLELCDGQRNTGEIISGLTESFTVERETLVDDLEPFIAEMIESGIIVRVPAEPK